MKTCSKCKQAKSIENFSKDKNRKDGYYPICKECVKIYNDEYYQRENVIEQRRIYLDEYNQREYVIERSKVYHKEYDWKERAVNQREAYRNTDHGREIIRDYHKKWISENRPKRQAISFVHNLVAKNSIPLARDCVCVVCGKQAENYHHHKGYDKQYWGDVIPVCIKCHRALDKKTDL